MRRTDTNRLLRDGLRGDERIGCKQIARSTPGFEGPTQGVDGCIPGQERGNNQHLRGLIAVEPGRSALSFVAG